MKVRYRHFSDPTKVKEYDMKEAFCKACFQPFCQDRHGRPLSLEAFEKQELEHFARDMEKGKILEYEVVKDN